MYCLLVFCTSKSSARDLTTCVSNEPTVEIHHQLAACGSAAPISLPHAQTNQFGERLHHHQCRPKVPCRTLV